jgi:hypothetical protein
MDSIFDLVTSQELAAYWTVLSQNEEPFIGEELWDTQQKRGLDIKWIKGAKGLPVVLKTAAFDSTAIPRARIGFDKMSASMPFFKESMYIDEELRQELNMVLETGNQAYIDSVMNRVFDDQVQLVRSAAVSRERMRMMALTTGIIAMSANGQSYYYDYNVTHKGNVSTSWSDRENSDPISDIREARDKVYDDTGVMPTRAICDGKTWRNIRNNDKIKKAIFVLSNGVGEISDSKLRSYIMDELEIEVVINDKRYIDESGATKKYVPENTFVLFPEGNLGTFWYGTTPEQSDLMSSSAANVSIVDTGVAVTTITHADPVNVETKVTQICLPSFEAADNIYILDTTQA